MTDDESQKRVRNPLRHSGMRAITGVDGLPAEGALRPVGREALSVAIQALPLASVGRGVRLRFSVSDHKECDKAHHWTAKDRKERPGELAAPDLPGDESDECCRKNPAYNRFRPHGRAGTCGKKRAHRLPGFQIVFSSCANLFGWARRRLVGPGGMGKEGRMPLRVRASPQEGSRGTCDGVVKVDGPEGVILQSHSPVSEIGRFVEVGG